MKTHAIAITLIKARKALNLTQIEVAESIGVCQSTYNNWESGKNTPNIKYLPAACKILKISDFGSMFLDNDVNLDKP